MSRTGFMWGGALLPGSAWAHAEHGLSEVAAPLAHFFTDPYHLGLAVVTVAALCAIRSWLAGSRSQQRTRQRSD